MPLFFSPYMEFALPVTGIPRLQSPAPLGRIKDAGFDGVECHLIGNLLRPERVLQVREEAASLGLKVRFHQGWSWETGQRNVFNVLLRPCGQLVPVGTNLEVQVQDAGTDPVVVYGNLLDEFPMPGSQYQYQTASEHVGGRAYAWVYQRFVDGIRRSRRPVVFDTQHVLEWSNNATNVAELPARSRRIFEAQLWRCWEDLGEFVKEIHLCDFDPRLGPSHGRNVFPGKGIAPIHEFCVRVRKNGWDGIVTPEVNPKYLKGDSLRVLRETVGEWLQ